MTSTVERTKQSECLVKSCLVCGEMTNRILTAPVPQDEGVEFVFIGICETCGRLGEEFLVDTVARELARVLSNPFRRVGVLERDGTISNTIALHGRVLVTEN
ncbi:MAG: hypothetical protein AB9866_12870 [Syntrophobacteraceae bacterium]